MLRYVSPLATFARGEVINRTRSDAASRLSLGTRIGLATASNDHQALRLTGSLSLARSSLVGFGFHVFSFSYQRSWFWFLSFTVSRPRASPRAVTPDRAPVPGAVTSCGLCLSCFLFLKSMARLSLAGSAFHFFFFLKASVSASCPQAVFGFVGWVFPASNFAARGLTILPIAHTNPLNSRPNAAAATWDFFRPTPVRCW